MGIVTLGKFHDHLQCHEVYRAVLDAFGLSGGVFHFVGAVGAVHVDSVGLFHGKASSQMGK